jgi:membrane protein required for colicin V production
MYIDIIYVLFVLFGLYKGLKRGFIRALFLFVSLWVGMLSAIKVSLWISKILHLQNSLNGRWLSFVSFILIFLVFAIIVRILGLIILKSTAAKAPGFLNAIGGGILYMVLYTMMFTVMLIYLYNVNVFEFEALSVSKTFVYIYPKSFKLLTLMQKVIPIFRNIFV